MPIGSPVAPNATTDTVLRTIPAATVGECSHILVTNPSTNNAVASIRIAIAATGTPAANEWIAHGTEVAPGETVSIAVADYIPTGQNIVVYSSIAGVAFRACGREVPA